MTPSDAYGLVREVHRRLPFLLKIHDEEFEKSKRDAEATHGPWSGPYTTPTATLQAQTRAAFAALITATIDPPHVYCWTAEMVQLLAEVVRAFPLDANLAPADLLTPMGCWVLEEPLILSPGGPPPRPGLRMFSYVTDGAQGVWCVEWWNERADTAGLPVPMTLLPWAFDVSLSDAVAAHLAQSARGAPESTRPIAEAAFTTSLRFFGAGVALLRQRLLVPTPPELPRHARRRLARLDADLSRLYVVSLRRTERARSVDEEAEREHRHVEWSHRWLVRGHWTQQPYGPQQSLRRAQWRSTYVKGPEDKPLKAEAERIFAVNR